jgi:competence protein ComEC
MKRILFLAFAASMVFAQTTPKKPDPPPAKAEPAKPEAPKTTITPSASGFVGNRDSKVYHKAGCKAVGKMKDKNKVSFASKAEAEKAGFKPCKECKP